MLVWDPSLEKYLAFGTLKTAYYPETMFLKILFASNLNRGVMSSRTLM